jgi:hypothetical protein
MIFIQIDDLMAMNLRSVLGAPVVPGSPRMSIASRGIDPVAAIRGQSIQKRSISIARRRVRVASVLPSEPSLKAKRRSSRG